MSLLRKPISSITGIYNPLEYGAVGDGVTDDTAILADITTKINTLKKGFIYVPPHANFLKSESLAFVGCDICGIYGGGTITIADNTDVRRGLQTYRCKEVISMNIKFKYTVPWTPEPNFETNLGRKGHCVEIVESENVFIDNIFIDSPSYFGIMIQRADKKAIVKNSKVINAKRDGIHIQNAKYAWVVDNEVEDCRDDSIAILNGLLYSDGLRYYNYGCFVRGNKVKNDVRVCAIRISGTAQGEVTGNQIDGASGSGILLEKWLDSSNNNDPTQTIRNLVISDNNLKNVATMIDNGSDADTVHGITVGRDCDMVSVKDNMIDGSTTNGIHIWSTNSANRIIVKNNELKNITGTAIPEGTSTWRIIGNEVF